MRCAQARTFPSAGVAVSTHARLRGLHLWWKTARRVMAPGLLSVTVDGALRHGAPGGQGG